MNISPQSDYHLSVTIESQRGNSERKRGSIFRGVPCKIFLPKNKHESVIAELELTDGQAQVIGMFGDRFFQMSIKGWLRSGGVLKEIQAKECYIPNDHWPMLPYGSNFVRVTLPLEVLDLTVTEIHEVGKSEEITDKGFGKGYKVLKPKVMPPAKEDGLLTFNLTENRDLKTYRTEERHYNGSISIKEGTPLEFDLTPQHRIKFNRHFHWDSNAEERKCVRTEILTASLPLISKNKKPLSISEDLLHLLDDFLLLCSIGTRWNTIRLGYTLSQWPYITANYQRGRSLPKHIDDPRQREKQDYETGLVDKATIAEFLRHAWPIWKGMSSSQQRVLKEVFQAIVHSRELDLQAGFIALYAALETMVLNFRRENDLEFVLSDKEQWKTMDNDLRKFIAAHPLFQGKEAEQKAKRQKAYEKVSEFNRVSFGTAFNAFCNQTSISIPHQDLWPVNGFNSLSWMRNQLVHGEVRGREEIDGLWMAKMHIEWLIERCVLCLLGWPIKNSRVRAGYLSNFTPYNPQNWETARFRFFSK